MRALKASEVECRIGTIARSGKSLTLLLYKDARVDMRILDEEYGPENWQCRYYEQKGTLFCSVGVRFGDDWVWKEDAGTPSNMEKQKGEASDAFKRACVRFGIGRELYTAPEIRVYNGNGCTIEQGDGKFVCWDRFAVDELRIEDGVITGLRIINAETGNSVFGWGILDGLVAARKASKAPEDTQRINTAEDDGLGRIRSLFPSYCAARNLTSDEAVQEICGWAGVGSIEELSDGLIAKVGAMMSEVVGRR